MVPIPAPRTGVSTDPSSTGKTIPIAARRSEAFQECLLQGLPSTWDEHLRMSPCEASIPGDSRAFQDPLMGSRLSQRLTRGYLALGRDYRPKTPRNLTRTGLQHARSITAGTPA